MLAIRLQRTGRKGHAMFRLVVQDARLTPTSGKIVAYLGSYDPHSKAIQIDKEKVAFYLEHGAQPSPRAVRLLKGEKVKLPSWVAELKSNKRAVRNPGKRRSTAPKDAAPKDQAKKEEPVKEAANEEPTEAVEPAEASESTEAQEAPAEVTPEVPEASEPPKSEPDQA